ncbi:ankyrin repeat domain-containing protein [Streptomyces sp. SAI-127]|uniref:ankyrin repeat domain-containing protein n=1 Tax=Streptomyces sp. SAI-127 TaxID=2940543 RepID=UPI002474B3B5|nr:ankyrin repeat domain-containing protein [Streptomyces sp. SAI-127]MDH6493740.1 ankyrin repeat protein [Streptomyces sp. SAI-127]
MTDGDRLGRVAVHYAVVDGDVVGVRAALAQGADPGAADGAGWTPLRFAAQAQEPVIVEELLAAGVSVDVPDGQGNTALWRVVFSYRGDPAVLRLLLAAGANAGLENRHGISPRGLAQRIANYDVAAHLAVGDVPPHAGDADADGDV